MITDLLMTLIMLGFMIFGINKPHFMLCLAVWVNIVKPQATSFGFLQGMPLSLLSTLLFFLVFLLNLNKIRVPKSKLYHFLMLMFMVWITIAHQRAQFPDVSWFKYDIAIKTLIFAYFIPFAITTKKQLEFFLWVSAASFMYFIFIAGFKSLMGGGGYGVSLIGLNGFMYAEGSTLSTLSICMIPIFLYLRKHSEMTKQFPKMKLFLLFMILCALGVLIGTQARTGLVALAVFVLIYFFQTQKKIKYIWGLVFFGTISLFFVTDEWVDRMQTMTEVKTSETSAIGRLVVWRWTLDYVQERPFFGGGFYAYNANAGILYRYQKGQEAEIRQQGGKAFHNIFFEVLGETGIGGLLLFSMIILHCFLLLKNRPIKHIPLFYDGKKAIQSSIIIYIAGGMFIGVAFYPWLYYVYCISIVFNEIENEQEVEKTPSQANPSIGMDSDIAKMAKGRG